MVVSILINVKFIYLFFIYSWLIANEVTVYNKNSYIYIYIYIYIHTHIYIYKLNWGGIQYNMIDATSFMLANL